MQEQIKESFNKADKIIDGLYELINPLNIVTESGFKKKEITYEEIEDYIYNTTENNYKYCHYTYAMITHFFGEERTRIYRKILELLSLASEVRQELYENWRVALLYIDEDTYTEKFFIAGNSNKYWNGDTGTTEITKENIKKYILSNNSQYTTPELIAHFFGEEKSNDYIQILQLLAKAKKIRKDSNKKWHSHCIGSGNIPDRIFFVSKSD